MVVNKMGTWCVVIQKSIATSCCPLPTGACMWKHRQTGLCCYDVANQDLRAQEIAQLVGLGHQDEKALQEIKEKLVQDIHKALK